MKLLCITQPESHPPFDTTVELYQRLAVHPDFELFHMDSADISDRSTVEVVPVQRALQYDEFLALKDAAKEIRSLSSFQLVFCRTDRPYPAHYMHSMQLHERQGVRFVNSPTGLLEANRREFHQTYAKAFLPDWISYGSEKKFKLWRKGSQSYMEQCFGMAPGAFEW
jgi:glutathione synthase